jgi:hypothetical protein
MSASGRVLTAGKLRLNDAQAETLAVHLGLAPDTPAEEIAAEVNGAPIAASHASRVAKHTIESELTAAVADGRILASAKPRWRSLMATRGAAGIGELRALTPVAELLGKAASTPSPSPAAKPVTPAEPESLLAARPFSLVTNVDEGARAAKVKVAPAPIAASADADGVLSDPVSGALSWNGLPVTPGPDGSPLVHTVNGAMSPAAFKAAGLSVETEVAAVGLARLTGSGNAAGLPRRNPLFGGG